MYHRKVYHRKVYHRKVYHRKVYHRKVYHRKVYHQPLYHLPIYLLTQVNHLNGIYHLLHRLIEVSRHPSGITSQSIIRQSTINQLITNQSIINQSTINQSIINQLITNQSITNQSINQPIIHQPINHSIIHPQRTPTSHTLPPNPNLATPTNPKRNACEPNSESPPTPRPSPTPRLSPRNPTLSGTSWDPSPMSFRTRFSKVVLEWTMHCSGAKNAGFSSPPGNDRADREPPVPRTLFSCLFGWGVSL